MICNENYTKIEHMQQALQFVKQRLYYNVCIFIYRILNNMLALRNRIEIVEGDSERQTRQAGNIRIPEI